LATLTCQILQSSQSLGKFTINAISSLLYRTL